MSADFLNLSFFWESKISTPPTYQESQALLPNLLVSEDVSLFSVKV